MRLQFSLLISVIRHFRLHLININYKNSNTQSIFKIAFYRQNSLRSTFDNNWGTVLGEQTFFWVSGIYIGGPSIYIC